MLALVAVIAWWAPRPSWLPLATSIDGPNPSQASAVIFYFHGLGGSNRRAREIATRLRDEGLPADTSIVFLEGPAFAWTGHSWGNSPEALAKNRQRIRARMAELLGDAGPPRDRVIVAGFSQGAGMAIDTAIEEPRVGALASFSPCWSQLRQDLPKRDLRILLAHGTRDARCPLEESASLARVLEAAHKPVQMIPFDGPHTVPREAVRALAAMAREPVDLLVVAPHPDDEVLMAGGVLARAMREKKRARVVVLTNGDFTCTRNGHVRQGETIDALASLGVREDDVTFLGYPDGWLVDLGAAPLPPLDRVMLDGSCAKTGGTYAERGEGHRDAHSARAGSPAPYTADALEEDLAAILTRTRPRDVYVAHPADTHPDHAATYEFLRRALDRASIDSPRIHRAIVHAGKCWPGGRARLPPCPPFAADTRAAWLPLPDPLGSYAPRELLRVDDAQAKLGAIAKFRSQLGDDPDHDWLVTFARAEEPFYPEILDGSSPRRVRATAHDVKTHSFMLTCASRERAIADYAIALDADGGRISIARAGTLLRAWATPLDARCDGHTWEMRIDPRDEDTITEISLWRDQRFFGIAFDP